jgi:hypothetical protein
MQSRQLDPELGALLACALAPAGTDLSSVLERLCGTVFPSERIVERAMLYQVRPQVAAQVRRGASSTAGGPGSALAAFAQANQGRGLLMAGELVRVLDGLRAGGVPAVPIKGPVFAELIGHGAGSREMNDLDLLVRPEAVAGAVHALAPLGYAPALPLQAIASPWLTRVTPELGLLGHRDTMLLELHWQLSPSWYPAPCSVDDVMARLTEQGFLHGRVLWPAPEELFLVHVADALKSRGQGVRWIADLVQIVRRYPDLDWARVRDVAVRRDGLSSVQVALAVADDLSNDTARMLDAPGLSMILSPSARALADGARRVPRLAGAVRSIRERLAADGGTGGAVAQFLWALRLADRPLRVTRGVARHVANPTVADLAAMPPHGESNARLRWRALRRRAAGRAR